MIRTAALIIGILGLSLLPTLMNPATAYAKELGRFGDDESKGLNCKSNFLGFPTWFDGLPREKGTCDVSMQEGSADGKATQSNLSSFIYIIVLNVIEIGLRLVGFAAVGFIIYGGFKYLTSAGSADRITSGRKMIQNALIGLVISLFSIGIVNFIASRIG